MTKHRILIAAGLTSLFAAGVTACTPTVQVAAPSEPIHINLNVKIDHEIYIRVAQELDQIFSGSSGLF